jgi:hypothetical protein
LIEWGIVCIIKEKEGAFGLEVVDGIVDRIDEEVGIGGEGILVVVVGDSAKLRGDGENEDGECEKG